MALSPAKKPPSSRLPCTGHKRESEDHMAVDGGERNVTDGKELERHFSHGERPQKWREHVAALRATRHNGHE